MKDIIRSGPRSEDRPDGWSLQDLRNAIEAHGFKMEPLETTLRDTLRARQPFILHTNLATGGHFMLVIPGATSMTLIDPLLAKPHDVPVKKYLGVTRLQDKFYGLFVSSDAERIVQRGSLRALPWIALAVAICTLVMLLIKRWKRGKKGAAVLGILFVLTPTMVSCTKNVATDSLEELAEQAISNMPFQIEEVVESSSASDGRFYSQRPFTSRLTIRNTSRKTIKLSEIKIANPCCSPAKLTKYSPEELEPGKVGWVEFEVNLESPIGKVPYSIMLSSTEFPESSINVNREINIVPSESRLRFVKPADFGVIDRTKEKAETIVIGLFDSAQRPQSLQLDFIQGPDFIQTALMDDEFTVEESVYGGYTVRVPIRITVRFENQQLQQFSESVSVRVNDAIGTFQCFGVRTGAVVVNHGKEMTFPLMHGQLVRKQFSLGLLTGKPCRVVSVREAESQWLSYEFGTAAEVEHLVKTKLKAAPDMLPAESAEFRVIIELADEDGNQYTEEFQPLLTVYQPSASKGSKQ